MKKKYILIGVVLFVVLGLFGYLRVITYTPQDLVPIAENTIQQNIKTNEARVATPRSLYAEGSMFWSDEMHKYTFSNGYIHLNGVKIEEIDPSSFQVITEMPFPTGPYSLPEYYILHYSKDKNNVFYDGKIISGAINTSFKVVWPQSIGSEQFYAKDERNVYYRGETLIPKADPGSFVPLAVLEDGWRVGGPYSRDEGHVYYENREVVGADWRTFDSEYEDGYASDKDHVFFKGIIIPNANPKNFSFPVSAGA